jgi:hypothetical protein
VAVEGVHWVEVQPGSGVDEKLDLQTVPVGTGYVSVVIVRVLRAFCLNAQLEAR